MVGRQARRLGAQSSHREAERQRVVACVSHKAGLEPPKALIEFVLEFVLRKSQELLSLIETVVGLNHLQDGSVTLGNGARGSESS